MLFGVNFNNDPEFTKAQEQAIIAAKLKAAIHKLNNPDPEPERKYYDAPKYRA